ncbi:SctK family type III secretion system sorting platform protein [Prosthecobacter dejongeii]|uniref:YOP protein translocation protein K (YscK) n=1 Tax=Prosthecobacter dejongeii TaxID=48465 RepID=A0A7W8DPW0_9BACT|nr:SctK family type III secretion system sorting platform protein [Prosthecobacter dejongeii]MBB5037727.1 hypothetical protein [Prosthecobacter dejongeii]
MNTSGHWYASQAKINPDLFRVIFDFNRRPQYWLHPEVVAGLPQAKVVRVLSQGTHGQSHLSSWLLQTLQLDDCEGVWDFEEIPRRLALLSPATLERLACFTGAALCWPRISAIIGKQQIQELKANLGEETHAFALRRARMIVPESETFPAQENVSLTDQVHSLGWDVLISATNDGAEGLRRRLLLKLPLKMQAKVTQPLPQDQREKAWQRVRQINREVLTLGEMKCFA